MTLLKSILAGALLLVFVSCASGPPVQPEMPFDTIPPTQIEQRPITTIDLSTWIKESVVIGDSNKQVAWRSGGFFKDVFRQWVTVNGTTSPRYRAVYDPLRFSPDGGRFAYVATLHDSDFVVVDRSPGRKFSFVSANSVTFSPDGKRLAYFASLADDIYAIVDNKREGPFTDVVPQSITFSDDGARVGYVAMIGDSTYVIVDGEFSEPSVGFAPDDPVFSPGGSHVAWTAVDSSSATLFIDGEPTAQYDASHQQPVVFSPDGSRWLAAMMRDYDWYVLVDGEVFGPYGEISCLQFSPNGKRTGWLASVGHETFAVIDGKRREAQYAAGDTLVFSPNGKRIAHSALGVNAVMIVADGEPGPTYPGIVSQSLTFSPDSKRLAYVADDGAGQLIILDTQEQTAFEYIVAGPVFSPDSRHVAYVGLRENQAYVVIDGYSRRANHSLWLINGGQLQFIDNTTIRYVAQSNGTFYEVTETLR